MKLLMTSLAFVLTSFSFVEALQQNNTSINTSDVQNVCPTFSDEAAIDKFLTSMIAPGKNYDAKKGNKFGFMFDNKIWQMEPLTEQKLHPYYMKSNSKQNESLGVYGTSLKSIELDSHEIVPADKRAGKRIRCKYKASGGRLGLSDYFDFTMTHIFQ